MWGDPHVDRHRTAVYRKNVCVCRVLNVSVVKAVFSNWYMCDSDEWAPVLLPPSHPINSCGTERHHAPGTVLRCLRIMAESHPVKMRRSASVVLTLGQRRRRWTNVKMALAACFSCLLGVGCLCLDAFETDRMLHCICQISHKLSQRNGFVLTLSSLNLPVSPSSAANRELLSQFTTCSGWRWLKVVDKWKTNIVIVKTVPLKCWYLNPLGVEN